MGEKSSSHVTRGKKGAAKRWGHKVSASGVLSIGNFSVDCFVLDNEERVIGTGSFLSALDMKGGGYKTGDRRIARFVKGKIMSQFVSQELINKLENPIKVSLADSKSKYTLAYSADCLVELCRAVLKASSKGALQKQQVHIAEKAEIIMSGCAVVGIVGLIDEATGYQYARERNALANVLEHFIAKEAAAWVKTFPDDFYRELFRLHGIKTIDLSEKPWRFGKITNDIVYKRLGPGVLGALEEKNPKDNSGRRRSKHHMWLTKQAHGELNRHLGRVTGIMLMSKNWDQAIAMLDKNYPRYPEIYKSDEAVLADESRESTIEQCEQSQRPTQE